MTLIDTLFNLIDIPTLLAAVGVSVILPVIRDYTSFLIRKTIKDEKYNYQKKLDWLRETQALAEKIEGFALTAYGNHKGVEVYEEDIFEEIKNEINSIGLTDVSTVREFERKVQSIEYLETAQYDTGLNNDRLNHGKLEELKEKSIQELKRNIREDYRNALSNKIDEEFYKYYQEMLDHYAHREINLEGDLYDAYIELQKTCYGFTISSKVEESDFEKVHDEVEELFELCDDKKEEVAEEHGLIRRILNNLGTK